MQFDCLQIDQRSSTEFYSIVIGLYALGQILASPVFGWWSNRSKSIMTASYFGLAFCFVVSSLFSFLTEYKCLFPVCRATRFIFLRLFNSRMDALLFSQLEYSLASANVSWSRARILFYEQHLYFLHIKTFFCSKYKPSSWLRCVRQPAQRSNARTRNAHKRSIARHRYRACATAVSFNEWRLQLKKKAFLQLFSSDWSRWHSYISYASPQHVYRICNCKRPQQLKIFCYNRGH